MNGTWRMKVDEWHNSSSFPSPSKCLTQKTHVPSSKSKSKPTPQVIREEGGRIFLVMEHAAHGDLLGWLKRRQQQAPPVALPSPATVRTIMRPLLAALAYLHARGYCHRDVKVRIIHMDCQAPSIPHLITFSLVQKPPKYPSSARKHPPRRGRPTRARRRLPLHPQAGRFRARAPRGRDRGGPRALHALRKHAVVPRARDPAARRGADGRRGRVGGGLPHGGGLLAAAAAPR